MNLMISRLFIREHKTYFLIWLCSSVTDRKSNPDLEIQSKASQH